MMALAFFGVRDWIGQWSLDKAGYEYGSFTARELRQMLDQGVIQPGDWVRHFLTGRYSLVGEVLYSNRLAAESEFENWFPVPELHRPLVRPRSRSLLQR